MELSIDKRYPGYDIVKAMQCNVFLDGKPLDACIYANEEEGKVICHKRNKNGNLVRTADGNDFETEVKYGKVVIEEKFVRREIK